MPLTITVTSGTSSAAAASVLQGHSLTPPAISYLHSSGQLHGRPQPTGLVQDDADPISHRARVTRSVSRSEAATTATMSNTLRRNSRYGGARRTTARLNISYEGEMLCTRSREKVYRLFQDATSSAGDADSTNTNSRSNSRLLARKALRYRDLLERVQQADLSDPTFNVADFCGITWRKRAKSKGSSP